MLLINLNSRKYELCRNGDSECFHNFPLNRIDSSMQLRGAMGIFYSCRSFHTLHYFFDGQVSEYPVFLDDAGDLTDVKVPEATGILRHPSPLMHARPVHVKLFSQICDAVHALEIAMEL